MKIINPDKRSDFMIRELHGHHEKFKSISALKLIIMDEFTEQVPTSTDFQLGYFSGKQSAKHWLMYVPGGFRVDV